MKQSQSHIKIILKSILVVAAVAQFVPNIQATTINLTAKTADGWKILAVDPPTGTTTVQSTLNGEFTPGTGFTYTDAVYTPGRYYVMQQFLQENTVYANTMLVFNDQWQQQTSVTLSQPVTAPLAYNSSDGKVYGAFTSGGTVSLSSFDLSTGTPTAITKISINPVAMAADAAGHLYAVTADAKLYQISTKGMTVEIGSLGMAIPAGSSTACHDPSGKKLYWLTTGGVYNLDTTTGRATKLSDFSIPATQLIGAYIRQENINAVPSWVDNLEILFNNDSLNGTVTFNLPANDDTGTPLSGTVSYEIKLNETVAASGTGSPGSKITAAVNARAAGKYTLIVYALNGTVRGPDLRQTRFIGHDTPKAPAFANATASDANNNVTLTWGAVTEGMEGGYINTAAIAYNIIRQPGDVKVAENVRSTSYTDNSLTSMGIYSYEITATDGVTTSTPTVTAEITAAESLGINAPWSHDFPTSGQGFFTVYDGNNDGICWNYSANDKTMWLRMSQSQESDDWLISPPINVTSNMQYNLRMTLNGSNQMETQRVEIRYGNAPTPEAMTNVAMRTTEFVWERNLNFWFEAVSTGKIYIGLHVTSKPSGGAIKAQNFMLSGAIDGRCPAQPGYVTATPGANGALSATVDAILPSLDFNGNTLGSISSVTIFNATTGKTVAELTGKNPGDRCSVTDNEPVAGINIYEVSCTNAYGTGTPRTRECWIGPDIPALPQNVSWTKSGNGVTIRWDRPSGGEHNGYLNFDNLEYIVYERDMEHQIYRGKAFSTTATPVISEQQELLRYYVCAVDADGQNGKVATSNHSAYGEAYGTPLHESFTQAGTSTAPWKLDIEEGNNPWYALSYLTDLSVRPFDHDGGMLVYTPLSAGSSKIETPVLDISSLSKPVIKFWHMSFDNNTALSVEASIDNGNSWQTVGAINPGTPARWELRTLSLDKFKGMKNVQFCIRAQSAAQGNYILVDNLSIADYAATDPMVVNLDVPARVVAGKNYTALATVANNGSTTLNGCTLLILHGLENRVASASVPAIAPDSTCVVKLDVKLSSNATETVDIYSVVSHKSDADPNNNSFGVRVNVNAPYVPRPLHLKKLPDNGDGTVSLTWDEVDNRCAEAVTDDFESYEGGSIGGIDVTYDRGTGEWHRNRTTGAIGPFKLVDNDGLLTGTLVTLNLPHKNEGMVCQVIDNEKFGMQSHSVMAPHSGNKYLCFWKAITPSDNFDVPNDDWLILPELAEGGQHISLWAKSITDKYGLESFDVMVSMDGDDTADFKLFTTVTNIAAGYSYAPHAGYSYYEFDLPEDTRYVAIRYAAVGTTGLLLDDITYTPADNLHEIRLTGYNVYRNDQLVNNSPVKTTTFTDRPTEATDYRYNVTAQFDEGESRYSNTVAHSLENALAECHALTSIEVINGKLIVTTEATIPVSIYNINGILIASETVTGTTVFDLQPGAYAIRAGNESTVVIIK